MVKRLLLAALLALVGPRFAFAGDIVVSNFAGGLDTLDTPAELDPSFAQDLLNVNIQPGGGAVFKRDGYGLFRSLPISCSTCAVHGGLHFQQVSGNDVQLWGNDVQLSGSVNDATFVNLATGTLGATWQCADSQGSAYCLTSSRDTPVKTDGTAPNTSYQPGIPLGTMATFSPTQLIVAGVTGNENTIYVSQQNAFTTFTIGVLPSSAFTEPIASPGSRITHLAYYFGKLFWWKDQSFGYATFTNQNDWQLTIVSNQIGTLDNSDAFWNSSGFDSGSKFTGTAQANAGQSPGGIFFRGQDNHFYVYDGYYLTRISRPITPTVATANRKKANAWSQSAQSDFQAGSIVGNLSTTTSPGDVIVSNFGVTENSSNQWSAGTTSNVTVNAGTLALTTNNSGNISNPNFESALSPIWGNAGTGTNWQRSSGVGGTGCVTNPQSGSNFVFDRSDPNTITNAYIETIDSGDNVIERQGFNISFNDCVWRQGNISPTAAEVGRRVRFRLHTVIAGATIGNGDAYLATTDSYIWGGAVSFWWQSSNSGNQIVAIDNIQNGSSTITSGSYTSQVYNTGFNSSTVQLQASFTANNSTPNFALFTSASNGGPFTTLLTSTGTSATASRYVRFSSTMTAGTGNALTSITSLAVVARSTGTYYSAVNNAPGVTSWGTFSSDDTSTLSSSITYFTRASTSPFSVLSATPAWVSQTKNSQVAASTGTYMQMRGDFYVTVATEALALNDFQFNWFEGSAADKAYMTYFNDAIWFSVSSSSNSPTNNRVFYWDILNGGWSMYDIAANGFQIENNALYFGDPVQGRIFRYGGVTTDNGLSINSYWRSKSFYAPTVTVPGGPSPLDEAFVQKAFNQADFVLGESSTTLTYTYTVDSKTPTVVLINAYDSAASLIQRDFLLIPGKIGKYYDFQIGDNSSAPAWRLMAHRVRYEGQAWRPATR